MPGRFIKKKALGEKIAALTAYDATFAGVLATAGVDCILVGDSLGMVVQGGKDTLAVRLSDVVYHTRAVVAGAPDMFVIGDMPFGTFQQSPAQAFANAARLLAAGAGMVKMEGGRETADTVQFLTTRGVPVCAHIGLLPQKVRVAGGYKVQGRDPENAARLLEDAKILQDAGAAMMIVELLPSDLAHEISNELTVPTIGIGCGNGCDGQILVLHDMLGLTAGKKRFVRNFLAGASSIEDAVINYVAAVKSREFPHAENSFD